MKIFNKILSLAATTGVVASGLVGVNPSRVYANPKTQPQPNKTQVVNNKQNLPPCKINNDSSDFFNPQNGIYSEFVVLKNLGPSLPSAFGWVYYFIGCPDHPSRNQLENQKKGGRFSEICTSFDSQGQPTARWGNGLLPDPNASEMVTVKKGNVFLSFKRSVEGGCLETRDGSTR